MDGGSPKMGFGGGERELAELGVEGGAPVDREPTGYGRAGEAVEEAGDADPVWWEDGDFEAEDE